MRISEFEGEAALDLIADLIEPIATILADPKITQMRSENNNYARIAAAMIKTHKTEVMQILAAMDGVPVAEYRCTPIKALQQLMDLLSDEELAPFLDFAPSKAEPNSSGSATANTAAKEK